MKQFILFFLVLLPVCAFAQFTETFDGPEIDLRWKGDRDKFIINSDGWLQQNDTAKAAGKSSLHTEITYSTDMQWEFDVHVKNKPSDSNYIRLYLYEVNSDSLYYIQIGHDKEKDSQDYKLSLNKTINNKLIKSGSQLFTEAPYYFCLKITLENNEYWTVYSRKAEETHYILEGTCNSPIPDNCSGGRFFITSKYTQGRRDNFSLDNIKITHVVTPTPLEPEDEQPSETENLRLLSLEEEEYNSLLLTFNMPVDASTASILLSGEEEDELYQSSDETILKPVWKEGRKIGESYSLSYSGIYPKEGEKRECKGNKSFTSRLGEDVVVPEIPEEKTGSILINEIMADPKGLTDFPETEYVELYNTTENTVTLSDWQFAYGGKAKPMSTFELPAGGYAVLYRSGRDIKTDPLAVQVPLENFPNALANNGKQLQLLDASGNLIDEVTYDKAKPGKSWERSSDGWHLSSDPRGGTPGSANSSGQGEPEQPEKPVEPDKPAEPEIPDDPSVSPTIKVEPKEFIFNELLPNPFAGGSEYFELYNRSDRSLPLSGLSVAVRKTDGTLSTRYPLSSINTLIEPDGYAVLTKSIEGVADFYMVTSPASLFEISKLPILANTSSTLVLFRTEDGTIIDEVSYSSKWHASSIKDQKGVALERIDPEAETQSPSNWTSASATAGYGTPGYRNSQSDISFPNEPDKPTGIEAPEWVPGSKHYKITYYLDQPGYSCRAFVFNTIGQRVAEIANHELLGLSGELTWDGASLAGSHLRTGVYIFYAELYHTSGTVKRYKQVFLVR